MFIIPELSNKNGDFISQRPILPHVYILSEGNSFCRKIRDSNQNKQMRNKTAIRLLINYIMFIICMLLITLYDMIRVYQQVINTLQTRF